MRIKPAPGLVVRDPTTKQPLPAEGIEVRPTSFWLRRLAVGDVTEVRPTPPPAQADEKKKVKP